MSEIQKQAEEVMAEENSNQLIRLNTEEVIITTKSPSLHSHRSLIDKSVSSGKVFYNERMI